jgi:septal ring factor EnvC (AmiA/AmiB activator)
MSPEDTYPTQPWNSDEGLFTVDSRACGEPPAPRRNGLIRQFRRLMRRMPRDVAAVLLRQAGAADPTAMEDDDSIEILADRGSPIYSAADGVVVRAGVQGGLGICIAIRHADGHVTRYAHCDERIVKRDDVVKRGQVIGRVGDTGLVPEPLLRFDVIGPGGKYVDPYRYLRRCDEG